MHTHTILLSMLCLAFLKWVILVDWSTSVVFMALLVAYLALPLIEEGLKYWYQAHTPQAVSGLDGRLAALESSVGEALVISKEARDQSGRLSLAVGFKSVLTEK